MGKDIMTFILSKYLQRHVSGNVKTISAHINKDNSPTLKLMSKFSTVEASNNNNQLRIT